MVKVCVHDTRDGPIGYGGIVVTLEMPAVPRLGDRLYLREDDAGIEIRSVLWTPYSPEYDVQIRGW